jgi:hypothetical protein
VSTSQLLRCLVPKPIARNQLWSAVAVLVWLCKPDSGGRDPSAKNKLNIGKTIFGEKNLISTQLVNDRLIEKFVSFFSSSYSNKTKVSINLIDSFHTQCLRSRDLIFLKFRTGSCNLYNFTEKKLYSTMQLIKFL